MGSVADSYSVVFILGSLASLLWLTLAESQESSRNSTLPESITSERLIDVGLLSLTAGLSGARISFVLLHWEYYSSNPLEILWFWQGGLTWVGGVIGVAVGLGLFAIVTQRSFWRLADALALPGAIMAVSAWSGCFLEGCAYGRLTDAGPWTPTARNMFGWAAPRWPTQSVGMIASAAIFIGLYWFRSRDRPAGLLAGLSLFAIAAVALALSFTRGDPVLLLADMRIDAIGAAGVLLLASGVLVFRIFRR
jgi:phosphatidylglycerol:prolipoprotein diacylglycerol transferase